MGEGSNSKLKLQSLDIFVQFLKEGSGRIIYDRKNRHKGLIHFLTIIYHLWTNILK